MAKQDWSFPNSVVVLFLVLAVCHLHSSVGISESLTSRFSSRTNSGVNQTCRALLEIFAGFSAEFSQCAICHATPINLCEACVVQYLNVIQAYKAILKMKDESGHACKRQLINLDRLQIIEDGFKYVSDLWQKGRCDSCFKSKNGSITAELSNSTLKFQSLFNDTERCLYNHYDVLNKSYNSSVCEDCLSPYYKMNEYYDSEKEIIGDSNICMDIVDYINKTRTIWSEELYCGRRMISAEIPLLLAISVIVITPIIFYVTSRKFSSKVESKVLHQKRLVKHLNCPSTSSSGSESLVYPSTSGVGS